MSYLPYCLFTAWEMIKRKNKEDATWIGQDQAAEGGRSTLGEGRLFAFNSSLEDWFKFDM